MPTMEPGAEEDRIGQDALAFAKANRRNIARRLTDPQIYLPEENPVSVFMAGSPGAGKTEASIELMAKIGAPVIRIDPDELRSECPGYNGANAYLFQPAVSILVEKIHDLALEQSRSFLLDGTLSNYERAKKNIDRSLGRSRTVQILYLYQEPIFAARDVVNRLKREYGGRISVDLLLKNNDNSNRLYRAGVDQIDNHIPEKYSRSDVEAMLKKI